MLLTIDMKLICFICLMPLLSYGQVVDYSKFHGVDIKNNLALPLRGISFLNYKNVKVFGKFPSRDSVVISSPEDLVSVILSANNKKWLLSYFENPKDALIFEQYNSKMLPNDTSKYFVMLSKMTIKRDNKERTIIKLCRKYIMVR